MRIKVSPCVNGEHTGSDLLSGVRKCGSSGQEGSDDSSDGEAHFDG